MEITKSLCFKRSPANMIPLHHRRLPPLPQPQVDQNISSNYEKQKVTLAWYLCRFRSDFSRAAYPRRSYSKKSSRTEYQEPVLISAAFIHWHRSPLPPPPHPPRLPRLFQTQPPSTPTPPPRSSNPQEPVLQFQRLSKIVSTLPQPLHRGLSILWTRPRSPT